MAIAKLSDVWMAMGLVGKQEIVHLVDALAQDYQVYGPVARGNVFAFADLSAGDELRLDYQSTILPPRKFFQRPREIMFSFREDVLETFQDIRPQVLFGIHPCDVNALVTLDRVFSLDYPDPYYQERRRNTVVIALNCCTVGDNCYCDIFRTGPALGGGYDLLLTDLGGEYLVEVGSEAGKEILNRFKLRQAPRVKRVEKERKMEEVLRLAREKRPSLVQEEMRQLLAGNYYHAAWEDAADRCLACGNCTMVCPTCFCFSVKDRVNLDLTSGQREREWDSCLFWDYSLVAMGHNFRPRRDTRLKQRLYHKLFYFEEQVGTLGCVGCGRCVDECPKSINPFQVISSLKEE